MNDTALMDDYKSLVFVKRRKISKPCVSLFSFNNMKKYLILFLLSTFLPEITTNAQNVDPLDLEFQRLAVRRFIFSNNIPLSDFVPSEIVSFASMHPAFAVSDDHQPKVDESFVPQIEAGKLRLDASSGKGDASVYVGGVNPYATYEIDIESIDSNGEKCEVGVEVAQNGLRNRIQALICSSDEEKGIYVRVYKNTTVQREVRLGNSLPATPFKLRVQLYGKSLGVFVTQNGQTTYVGHIPTDESFADIIDFRRLDTFSKSTFNIYSNRQGKVLINKAGSYLSSGIGQADIRLISYEDLSPYMDDGRLWFTFSCRGIDTSQAAQGVLSLDPSVFDVRFEGMIVFDHGDGLLRNDYASHLFYNRKVNEWCAYVSDFGGSFEMDKRSATGLVIAQSPKDPRKGFSVMRARRIELDAMEGHNEDPCVFFDSEAEKWRLLTSAFINGDIVSRTYESNEWNGKFVPVAMPIKMNSTGTSIQKIGNQYYCLMGGHGNLRVHSYPDLKHLGELNLNLQPHWPKPAGRIWASVVPLPEGYPHRYVLLTMDRPNFPDIKGSNWSYGALYFYGANPVNISSADYEYK